MKHKHQSNLIEKYIIVDNESTFRHCMYPSSLTWFIHQQPIYFSDIPSDKMVPSLGNNLPPIFINMMVTPQHVYVQMLENGFHLHKLLVYDSNSNTDFTFFL